MIAMDDFGFAKVESLQVTSSVKYRMVYHRLTQAIKDGEIKKDTRLVEASAGSTGVALAYAGKQLGLPVDIHTFEGESPKYDMIKSYGAQLRQWPKETKMKAILQYIKSFCIHKNGWHLNQFNKEHLRDAYQNLGEEIIEQFNSLEKVPEHFLCPVGTGGIIHGVGNVLKQHWPKLKVLSFEPSHGSSLDGMRNTDDMNLGEDDPFDQQYPDRRYFLEDDSVDVPSHKHLGRNSQLIISRAQKENINSALLLAAD
jgi:cysteine synthase